MRGPGWVRCETCGTEHVDPYPDLHRDAEGAPWNLCAGLCAAEAGMDKAHIPIRQFKPLHDARYKYRARCTCGWDAPRTTGSRSQMASDYHRHLVEVYQPPTD